MLVKSAVLPGPNVEFNVSWQEFPSIKHGHTPTLKVTSYGHHFVNEEPVFSGDSLAFLGTSASAYGSLFKKGLATQIKTKTTFT